MQITFLGATRTVTGSKFLLTTENKKILVDCGLFQGYKELRLRNWAELPIDAKNIDAVLLTHAHIDHSGYIPLLVKQGFRGPIYCTHATLSLCEVLLPDSGYLQEEEAYVANKYGYSKHHPALPLYTKQDALDSLKYFETVPFAMPVKLDEDFFVRFNRAGHILGASTLSVTHDGLHILFSGDLGRPNDPVMHAPAQVEAADYLVIEGTYGNRRHSDVDPMDELAEVITRTAKRGGTVIIPAFAVGRAQDILYFIHKLREQNRIPTIPVYLDSPMAIDATEIFYRYVKEHKLTRDECHKMCSFVRYTNTVEESKELDHIDMPIIIVSASGMVTGGRVLHHIKALAGDHRNTILFTGYQAGGTRGDRITRGEREVKMLGQMVRINAEVVSLSNTSAHADYVEMLEWLSHIKTRPRKVFIVHAEQEAAIDLQQKITERFGWKCVIPEYLHTEELV